MAYGFMTSISLLDSLQTCSVFEVDLEVIFDIFLGTNSVVTVKLTNFFHPLGQNLPLSPSQISILCCLIFLTLLISTQHAINFISGFFFLYHCLKALLCFQLWLKLNKRNFFGNVNIITAYEALAVVVQISFVSFLFFKADRISARLDITLSREVKSYLLENYLPSTLFTVISWGSFLIIPTIVPGWFVWH
jgi:hypothetical protein